MISLRDEIAMRVMTELLRDWSRKAGSDDLGDSMVAEVSYWMADGMLTERVKSCSHKNLTGTDNRGWSTCDECCVLIDHRKALVGE